MRLQTQTISQLSPRLSILNASGNVLQQAAAAGLSDRDLTLTIPQTVDGDAYYVRVQAAADGLTNVGSYAIVVTHDNRLTADLNTLDPWLAGPVHLLSDADFLSLYEDDEGLLRDDDHTDDEAADAVELDWAAEFAAARRTTRWGAWRTRAIRTSIALTRPKATRHCS